MAMPMESLEIVRVGVSSIPTAVVDLQLVSRLQEQSTIGAAPARTRQGFLAQIEPEVLLAEHLSLRQPPGPTDHRSAGFEHSGHDRAAEVAAVNIQLGDRSHFLAVKVGLEGFGRLVLGPVSG